MVSSEDRDVRGVSAGCAQLLRVAGCLVSEVRSLKVLNSVIGDKN